MAPKRRAAVMGLRSGSSPERGASLSGGWKNDPLATIGGQAGPTKSYDLVKFPHPLELVRERPRAFRRAQVDISHGGESAELAVKFKSES